MSHRKLRSAVFVVVVVLLTPRRSYAQPPECRSPPLPLPLPRLLQELIYAGERLSDDASTMASYHVPPVRYSMGTACAAPTRKELPACLPPCCCSAPGAGLPVYLPTYLCATAGGA